MTFHRPRPDTGQGTAPDIRADTEQVIASITEDTPGMGMRFPVQRSGPDTRPGQAPDIVSGDDTVIDVTGEPSTGTGPDIDRPDSDTTSTISTTVVPTAGGEGSTATSTENRAKDDIGDNPARKAPDVQVGVARREVLPSWVKNRDAFTGLVRERISRGWRWAAFHVLRLPWYWLRACLQSPVTVARATRWVFDTVTDVKGREVRRSLSHVQSLGGVEGTAFHRVTGQHKDTIKARTLALGFVLTLTAALGLCAWLVLPSWVWWAVLAVVLPVLGWARRDPEHPVVTSSVVAQSIPAFREDLIASALDALGIAGLSKGLKVDGLQLAGPIHRDGPGWRADVDLPAGVTAGDVIERRDKLAAGLRRPLVVVWPSADPDVHEARLILWVGDKPLNKTRPRPWPLAKAGRVDLFKPFPVGVDQRGKPVTMVLMFASMVIGAIPRMGKTFALRVILLAAALDHLVELHTYDLKGGADLRPLGQVSHRHRIGDEDEDIAYLADDMADLVSEMARRYKVIRGLPERICPEGKVTPELAARKALRLHPIVVGIDECQLAFEHPNLGKKIEADITDLVKRGPAVAMHVILATQRPDAKSIPAAISGNAVLRFCLKVMGHQANDMVLGSGTYKAGIRATMFGRSEKGTGYLVGEGDDPQIVTFAYVDGVAAQKIAARARALREAEGTPTGYAADLDHEPETTDPAPTLLDDLADVMTVDAPRVWSEDLLARLIEARPGTYSGWTATDLGNAATAYGLGTVQIGKRVSGKVVNRRGIDRADVTTAITLREDKKVA